MKGATEEIAAHPSFGDPARTEKLFLSAVRRRSLKYPARCELPDEWAALHQMSEPSRSLEVLQWLTDMPSSDLASIVGVDRRRVPEPISWHPPQFLEPSPGSLERIQSSDQELARHSSAQWHKKHPVFIAVGLGMLVLFAIVIWNMTGRVGSFPEEAVKIATQAGKAPEEDFIPVESPTGDLPDWFALQGYDVFHLPEGFDKFQAVGVRVLKIEGESVAQIAVIDGGRGVFFLAFPSTAFGITVLPEGTWRITKVGRRALAIREDRGNCFMVSFEGTEEEMKEFLARKNLPSRK